MANSVGSSLQAVSGSAPFANTAIWVYRVKRVFFFSEGIRLDISCEDLMIQSHECQALFSGKLKLPSAAASNYNYVFDLRRNSLLHQ